MKNPKIILVHLCVSVDKNSFFYLSQTKISIVFVHESRKNRLEIIKIGEIIKLWNRELKESKKIRC